MILSKLKEEEKITPFKCRFPANKSPLFAFLRYLSRLESRNPLKNKERISIPQGFKKNKTRKEKNDFAKDFSLFFESFLCEPIAYLPFEIGRRVRERLIHINKSFHAK